MYPEPPNRTQRNAAAKGASRARARLAEDLERLTADAGLAPEQLARAAGIPGSYLRRILSGSSKPSVETYTKLATALGADVAARVYPNTGPPIRDRHQAKVLEGLLQLLGGTWRPHPEATVWKPVRGAIDAVLHDRRAQLVVASEIESDMRRIEQAIRWSKEKADALSSWSGWPSILSADGAAPRVSQLLIVRRTRANERVAREFGRQLSVAYPAHPEDALAALRGEAAWPGSALMWARIETDRVRFLATR